MDKFSWLIDLIFILCSLLFLILCSTSYVNYKYNPQTISEYKQNWNLGPIIDIIEISIDKECPDKYFPIFTNNFPGNSDGCDCRNTDRKPEKKKFYAEACSLNKIADQCVAIKKQEKIYLEFWRGKKICVKRLEKNFWELEIISEKNEGEKISKESFIQLNKNSTNRLKDNEKDIMYNKAPSRSFNERECKNENHKVCGNLDESKNLLCVNKNIPCPINGLFFMDKASFNKKKDKDIYKSISLNENMALYFTNKNTKGDIYIELFALTDVRCIIPDEGKFGENNYPLNNVKGEMNCKTVIENIDHDFRYKILDEYSQDLFNKENLIDKRIQKLKGYMAKDKKTGKYLYYQEAKNNKIKLYYSKYMGWNKNCAKLNAKDNFLDELLDPSKEDVESSKAKLYFLCFLSGFNMVLQIFFYFVVKLVIYKNKLNFIGVVGFDFYIFLINIFILIFVIMIYKLTADLIHPAYVFSKYHCGDETTSKVLNYTFIDIMDIFPRLITIMVIASLQIIFFLGFYGYNYKKIFNTSYKRGDETSKGLIEF